MSYMFVALGAALGGMVRYFVSQNIQPTLSFPWVTFTVNMVGSFLLGVIIGKTMPDELRLFLGVGFCGGFTTFSTFSAESLHLFRSGEALTVFLYIIFSTIGGLVSLYLGTRLTSE